MNVNDVAAEAKAVGLAAIRAAAGDSGRTTDAPPERTEREAVDRICDQLRGIGIDALPCWPAIRAAIALAYTTGQRDQARESLRQIKGGFQCQA